MRAICVVLAVLVSVTLIGCQGKKDPEKEAAAAEEALAWLQMVDRGAYEESWRSSAAFMKDSVTLEQWVKTMEQSRKPMGALVSREVNSSEYRTMLPKVLMGHYVIIEYHTTFANATPLFESITLILEEDGRWRVGGYYLK